MTPFKGGGIYFKKKNPVPSAKQKTFSPGAPVVVSSASTFLSKKIPKKFLQSKNDQNQHKRFFYVGANLISLQGLFGTTNIYQPDSISYVGQ